jgi:hypothetical protein
MSLALGENVENKICLNKKKIEPDRRLQADRQGGEKNKA